MSARAWNAAKRWCLSSCCCNRAGLPVRARGPALSRLLTELLVRCLARRLAGGDRPSPSAVLLARNARPQPLERRSWPGGQRCRVAPLSCISPQNQSCSGSCTNYLHPRVLGKTHSTGRPARSRSSASSTSGGRAARPADRPGADRPDRPSLALLWLGGSGGRSAAVLGRQAGRPAARRAAVLGDPPCSAVDRFRAKRGSRPRAGTRGEAARTASCATRRQRRPARAEIAGRAAGGHVSVGRAAREARAAVPRTRSA
jgi:hypothetical protein